MFERLIGRHGGGIDRSVWIGRGQGLAALTLPGVRSTVRKANSLRRTG